MTEPPDHRVARVYTRTAPSLHQRDAGGYVGVAGQVGVGQPHYQQDYQDDCANGDNRILAVFLLV